MCNSNCTFQLSTPSPTKIPEVIGTTDYISTFEINCFETCEREEVNKKNELTVQHSGPVVINSMVQELNAQCEVKEAGI